MKETMLERQARIDREARERVAREAEEQEARTARFVAAWEEERRAQCGTPAGYSRHRRIGEEPCDACRQGNREYNRAMDKRKREKRKAESKPVPKPRELKPCGTTAAARRHHRKGEELCDLCREAHRQDMADLNATRKRLRAEGKTLAQVSAQKRAERERAEREKRWKDDSLQDCCGAPCAGDEPTSKYAKRHWTAKTSPCEPSRRCRNLADRRKWKRDNPAEPRELEPCGTAAAFQRHKYRGEEPCQPCREAHNIQSNIYKKALNERRAAAAEPMPCCGAPVDGSGRSQKYAWRHKQAGTPPCRAAKDCRNAMDRKIYKSRRCADDVNERRKMRREAIRNQRLNANLMPCCGAPLTSDDPSGKYTKRHYLQKTEPCRPAKDCRNLVERKGRGGK